MGVVAFDGLEKEPVLIDLMAYAAFGLPRALLNMVRLFYSESDKDEDSDGVKKLNSRNVLKAIRESYESTLTVYLSLKHKLPIYQDFIESGEELIDGMFQSVKNYNKQKPEDRQSVSVAVHTPLSGELERVFRFLEYAGLLRSGRKVSRGVKGRFEIFDLHAGGLIDKNAIIGMKSVKAESIVRALATRSAHEFTRVTPASLLKVEDLSERLALTLPPCDVCGTPRASETAKFCLNCGSPLKALSTFRTLVRQDINQLPLSPRRVERIKENSSIATVGDILIDHEHKELRSVPWVGPYWAKRIYRYAEEYIA